METFPFIKEKYHPVFISSSHNQGWLDVCQDPAVLSQTCHSSSVLGSEANTCYCTHRAIDAALPSPVGDVPYSYSSSSQNCWQQKIFPGLGKPWQWQHVLGVSSLSCSTAMGIGQPGRMSRSVWFVEVGNAGHLGFTGRLSGSKGSKLFCSDIVSWKKTI